MGDVAYALDDTPVRICARSSHNVECHIISCTQPSHIFSIAIRNSMSFTIKSALRKGIFIDTALCRTFENLYLFDCYFFMHLACHSVWKINDNGMSQKGAGFRVASLLLRTTIDSSLGYIILRLGY